MLQISHLYANYGGKPALEDINLTLESGELLVVLGPSGCGKTTLLNLIAGFVPYQHGSIQLAGKRIEGPGAERGVVFQNEGLLPWRNVQNNVAFGLQLAGIEKMQRLEIAHQMLKKVGLEGAENATSGSSPAVNVSGWALLARWRQIPSCYYSTNRLVRWMPSPATRCKPCC
ncbi:taurine ABC transporter ATP-binding protein [Escherichia coli]|nr:taurine ABC transporter ATP-binding protein [Escherichia coli]